MKVNVELDMTPEELRRFLGLPDAASMQAEMMEKFRENMAAGMEGFDPQAMMKLFTPEPMQAMQQQFWQQMMNAMNNKTKEDE